MNQPIVSPFPTPTIEQAAQSLAAGRWSEASRAAEALLKLRPDDFDALHLLGVVCAVRGRLPEAIRHYETALRLRPDHVDVAAKCASAHLRRAHALLAAGDAAGAVGHCRAAGRLAPERGEHLAPLAGAQMQLQDYDEADATLATLLARAPNDYDAHLLGGMLALRRGLLERAIGLFGKAAALNRRAPAPLLHLAETFRAIERPGEAVEAARAAAKLVADNPNVLAQLAYAQMNACDWRGLDTLLQRLNEATARRLQSGDEPPHPTFMSVLLTQNPSRNLAVARANAARLARQSAAQRAQLNFKAEPRGRERPRIGYLSPDFGDRPTGRALARVLELHDRDLFRVVAYSYGADDGSAYRRRIAKAVSRFVELGAAKDADIARQIHADGIDILVDLHGWSAGGRPGIAALRPAPIQVGYLGFPGTSGADFMDYIVIDQTAGSSAQSVCLAEAPVYLPDTFRATDDRQPIAALTTLRADAGLPTDGFVFACFNDSCEIDPLSFGAWMRILDRTPRSVLWLAPAHAVAMDHLRSAAAAAGVDPRRLIFASPEPQARHLARLQLADLALETWACNGRAAVDALWVGVPVLAMAGGHFASRTTASLLRALELPELIRDSLPHYESAAIVLATDAKAARALRGQVAVKRMTAPLFDSERFTRNLEAAFAEMQRLHLAGERPHAIDVAKLAKP